MFKCFTRVIDKKKSAKLGTLELASLSQMYRFTPEEVILHKQRFERMATNGGVTLENFRESMWLLGLDSTAAIADRIFKVMNSSKTGIVSFEEFLNYMDVLVNGTAEEKAEQSFYLITLGAKDAIDFEDFSSWLNSMWEMYNNVTGSEVEVTNSKLREHFQMLDSNRDGVIDLKEYKLCMKKNPQVFEWFNLVNLRIEHGIHPTLHNDIFEDKAQMASYISDFVKELKMCIEMLEGICPLEKPREFLTANPREKFLTFNSGKRFVTGLRNLVEEEIDPSPQMPQLFMGNHEDQLQMIQKNSHNLSAIGLENSDEVSSSSQEISSDEESDTDLKSQIVSQRLKKLLRQAQILKLSIQVEQPSEDISSIGRTRRGTAANIPKMYKSPKKMKKSFIHWGDEDWNLILSMMVGIQKSVKNAAMNFDPSKERSKSEFREKNVINLLPGQVNVQRNCKFKDYAPYTFERIRRLYGITSNDYITSLGIEKIMKSLMLGEFSSLVGLCSSGKSGSFFYYSDDGKFMLKTMSKEEFVFFKRLVPQYYNHLKHNPDTLMTRIFGFHTLRQDMAQKIYFVVMGNVFSSGHEIHERYDLKGSTYGRYTSESEDATVARKDLDFTKKGMKISLGSERAKKIIIQMRKDCRFFKKNKIIDYSLLLGIHYLEAPDPPVRQTPWAPLAESDNGGLLSADCSQLYFIGIIDILTLYNSRKKLEHLVKSTVHGSEISCVPPKQYAERFLNYMISVIE